MKIHYNGTTTDFILYNVLDLIGNHLSMVKSIIWKGKDFKIIFAGESEISK